MKRVIPGAKGRGGETESKYRLLLHAIAVCVSSCGLQLLADDFPTDVVQAFTAIGAEGRAIPIQSERTDVPSGGHLQGVQMLDDPTNNRVLTFLSHDSNTVAYVMVVAFPATLEEPGRVIHVHRFPRDGLRHAGGIQLLENVLVVGLEDNRGKHRSEIRFLDVSEVTNWKVLEHLTIQRQGLPEDKTAGAVAVTSHAGRTIVAVANWDSRALDFYGSNGRTLSDRRCQMEFLSRWNAPEDSGSWQAINFIPQADGELYICGLHLNKRLFNTADLFQVTLLKDADVKLTPVSSRQFHLNQGNSFQAGAGLRLQDRNISILATPLHLAGGLQIDIVEPVNTE